MGNKYSQSLLLAAFTAVFIGYFSLWLPGPGAGLQFIGLEIGEWIKFLGVGFGRNYFYLPPITLGIMLALITWTWPNGRWQNWTMRGLAVAVSLLSFPAIEAIQREPSSEWLLRLILILLVILLVGLTGIIESRKPSSRLIWLLIAILGLVGAALPTWFYLVVRPVVSEALGLPVGIGLGVWLNGAGHLLATAVASHHLRPKT